MMDRQFYLFIDGAYVNALFEDRVRKQFGDFGGIRFNQISQQFDGRRTFYYDCLNDIKLDGEAESDFQQRVEAQQATFDEISGFPGYHVRLGTLSGNSRTGSRRQRRQQKEIDVLLAVDMMNHAFRRNFDTATLLAGDLDFKPVVESVVALGCEVRVVADLLTRSHEMAKSADTFIPLMVRHLISWTDAWNGPTPHSIFPSINANDWIGDADQYQFVTKREGTVSRRRVFIGQLADGRFHGQVAAIANPRNDFERGIVCRHSSRELVEKYLILECGEIQWI